MSISALSVRPAVMLMLEPSTVAIGALFMPKKTCHLPPAE